MFSSNSIQFFAEYLLAEPKNNPSGEEHKKVLQMSLSWRISHTLIFQTSMLSART